MKNLYSALFFVFLFYNSFVMSSVPTEKTIFTFDELCRISRINSRWTDRKDWVLSKIKHNDINGLHLRVEEGGLVYKDGGGLVYEEDIRDTAALHQAAYLGFVPLVYFLLQKPDINVNVRDNKGNTPLHYLGDGIGCEEHQRKIQTLLLEKGADKALVNHENKTPKLISDKA